MPSIAFLPLATATWETVYMVFVSSTFGIFFGFSLGGLKNDYTSLAGFTPSKAVLLEGPDSPYGNIIAVKTENKDNPIFKKRIAAIHSKEYLEQTLKTYPHGGAIPAN